MPDTMLHTYRILLAPVLKQVDGVADDPAALEIAEAILVAVESADGVGPTRSETASRAGIAPDGERFRARFAMLANKKAGSLQCLRGEKKHEDGHFPDPMALLAAEILARLSRDDGRRGTA